MHLSVIIPAYNEQNYLAQTVSAVREAHDRLEREGAGHSLEIIVVDNDSDDQTGEIAGQLGCHVITELAHNISRVRNAGARVAEGEVLVFIDADTLIPVETLSIISREMEDETCLGGAVDVRHMPSKRLIRWYAAVWRKVGLIVGIAQGATQFCRSKDFLALGGYDERQFMGEDVDFYWRMRRRAESTNRRVVYVDEIQVVPSPRRFDQWPIWRTLLLTNPLVIAIFRQSPKLWSGWYRERPK